MTRKIPLLTDQERKNLVEGLRNPQLRGWSNRQILQAVEVFKLDKAERIKLRNQIAAENEGIRLTQSGARGFYSGAASVLGAPVDAVNFLTGLSRISKEPVGGSKSIMKLFEQIPGVASDRSVELQPGTTVDVPLGQTFGERVSERTGEEIGAGVAGIGGLGAAARASAQSSTALGRAFVDPMRTMPGTRRQR